MRMHWKRMSWAAVLLAGVAMNLMAQEPVKPQAFDVVSMRPGHGERDSTLEVTANGYRAVNVNLMRLIVEAYVPGGASKAPYYDKHRIVGVADWMKFEPFDVDARVAEADREAWQKPALQKTMLHAMLQTMLAERCKLEAHREMRDLPIYTLQVAKNGPKLKAAETVDLEELVRKHPGGVALPEGGVLVQGREMSFFGTPLAVLAEMLSVPAGRPVEDKTGLTGRFDFVLRMKDPNPPVGDTEAVLSIFTALPEQLGLRLEAGKGQVEMLVIDHVERPSEN